MKLLLVLSALIVSNSAFSCPDLTGKFNCVATPNHETPKNYDGETSIYVKPSKGAPIYILPGLEKYPLKANGLPKHFIEHDMHLGDQLVIYSGICNKANLSVNFAMPGIGLNVKTVFKQAPNKSFIVTDSMTQMGQKVVHQAVCKP